MTKEEKKLAATIYLQGVTDCWKIVSDIDREHPECRIPLEMFKRFKTLQGKYEDRLEELK